jgi:hypothetical protein
MLSVWTASSVTRREVDPSKCLLYQAPLSVLSRVVGSRIAPSQYFEPASPEILELVCSDKNELGQCTGLHSAGAHE